MNRNELKGIVKECLLEILMEGVKGTSQSVEESRQVRKPQVMNEQRRSPLDTVTYTQRPNSVPKPPMNRTTSPKPMPKENFRDLANGNDVMASIFADTASSTLMEQRESSFSGMGNHAASNPSIETGVDPNLMEGASKWALLAFSEKRPGQHHQS